MCVNRITRSAYRVAPWGEVQFVEIIRISAIADKPRTGLLISYRSITAMEIRPEEATSLG